MRGVFLFLGWLLWHIWGGALSLSWAQPDGDSSLHSSPVTTPTAKGTPVEIRADKIEYSQVREEYIATGSVDIVRGPVHLTSDEATLQKLTGQLVAKGHVHLRDAHADIWSEQLHLNLNTEAGVITYGEVFYPEQNAFITGRRIQRFSETHLRIKEGSFTNCDAQDGQVPAWRFTFDDLDLEFEDSLFGKGVWFKVNDVPVVPFPTFRYPLGASRKSGLLVPTTGIDTVFGFKYRQGFFWVIDPSQDMTFTPYIWTKRGGGMDWQYRYILDRQSRGQWFVSGLHDTERDRNRLQIHGAHVQQFNPDLSLRMNVNYTTDRTLLQDISSSGVQRALPSQENNLTLLQRLDHGALYLWGQYLQPLGVGGNTTFQRLPEVGHRFVNPSVLGSPIVLNTDTTYVNFFREKGFNVSRLDFLPGMAFEGLHLGHTMGIRPQVKFREVVYSRGTTDKSIQNRETVWLGAEAYSYLSRRFTLGEGNWLRHAVEPRVIYEFVPPTQQSRLVQIDAVDNLIKKSLVTYSLKNRLSQQGASGASATWVDLLLAQSYHVGTPPPLASKFSDVWARGQFHKPLGQLHTFSSLDLTVDAFLDPKDRQWTQVNTDALIQSYQTFYFTVGQRYTRAGPRVRRGDIWNPISFNEVLAPGDKILFLTTGGAVRLPFGLTVGTRWYHDFRTGKTAEWDVMGLYQNPCKCFSVGLYYIRLPDRQQYDFLISLTGLWGTQGYGTELMKLILGPIMGNERGVPWHYR